MNRKERRAAKKEGRGSVQTASASEIFARALQLHQAGNLAAAELAYRQVLAREPDHAEALQFLGLIAHQAGEHDKAIELMGRAIALNDKAPHFHANLGEVLRAVGRLNEAAASQRQALALNPDMAEAYNNLGNVLEQQGKLDEALASYERAVALRPNDPGMLFNLAATLLASADPNRALDFARQALRIADTPEIKLLVGNCLKEADVSQGDAELRAVAAHALSEPWGRPQDLTRAAMLLLKQDWHAAFSDPADWRNAADDNLLRSLLENVVVADRELEQFLARMRSTVLDLAASASASDAVEPKMVRFCCSLARQCFINEYVYDRSADDWARAQRLCDGLAVALREGASIAPLHIAVVAAYLPLHTVSGAENLLDRNWPDSIVAVLTQQLREPAQERILAASLPALTPIKDQVSRDVQRQYEENPYPRWVKAMPAGNPTTIDAFLSERYPHARLRPIGKGGAIDLLVAGCGTGQHSIETARLFGGARMLAIDLSRASLAYAKRQTQALGLAGIDYAQADILELGTLGRSFDVIESTGVLHHLDDPMTGWRVLVSLLRPGGLMRLGFYSERARQDIVAARRFIAEQGFGDSADEIRRARHAIIAAGEEAPFASVAEIHDFYSISTCRDLLFHVQEHRLTLPEIASFLEANGLRLIGLDVSAHVARHYRACFPEDGGMTDLALWHQFETENPQTFRGMYQFWVQKEG